MDSGKVYSDTRSVSEERHAISMASPSRLSPPPVPMELHLSNRQKLLNSLRHHLSDSSRPLHGFVFLQVNSLSSVSSLYICIYIYI